MNILYGISTTHAAPSSPRPECADDHSFRRVIYASPEEFVSAVKSPYVAGRAPPSESNGTGSRLAHFFRIVKKNWDGHDLRLEVRPLIELPLMPTEGPTIAIHLREQFSRAPNVHLFKAELETALIKTSGDLRVEPHPSGALLTFSVPPSFYSRPLMATFSRTVKTLGFTNCGE